MKNKVLITVKSMHGAEEPVELVTVGEMETAETCDVFTYDEMLGEPEDITHNTLTIGKDGSVNVRKTGAIETSMVFVENAITESTYSMPFGELIFKTKVLKTEYRKEGGKADLTLQYELFIDGSMSTVCTINIFARPLKM